MPFDKEAPIVSFSSLDRAGRALYAFSKVHFAYHNLPRGLFQHFGLWVTLESLVYSADTLNEEGGFSGACAGLHSIRDFLDSLDLFDHSLAAELEGARTYFSLEKNYMSGSASLADIRRAATLRSFDFRLLHRVLWRLKKWPEDEVTFQCFATLEEVMEYDDDAASIEKDGESGTFNVIRALTAHGPRALVDYCEDLVQGVQRSIEILGPRFTALLQVYYALSPETVLASGMELRTGGNAPLEGAG
jgi:hypothetical protein